MKEPKQTQQERVARDIFMKAVELDDTDARAAYIKRACKDDASLRSRVEALVNSHQSDTFLELPAIMQLPEDTVENTVEEAPFDSIRGGRYKLLEIIGEGGMGVVYMAEQTEPVTRKVALKIIKLGMDTKQVVARFEAERQALAMMDHPNIAKVLDGGTTETGHPYFVMELVQGIPITEFCDKNKLTPRERIELFLPVCQAIQSAHQKGIIHRDIKPNNVLVSFLHGEPVAKVIDFGIAKATNQKLTEKTLFTNFATMIGTPAYMSPEQAELSVIDVDTRTDIYSLGVLLYELLTGTTPFPEKRLLSAGYGEMRRIIAEEDPEKPSTRMSTMEGELKTAVSKFRKADVAQLQRGFKGDLDWITMKCLEKDRRRRYETPNDLVSDLRRHLADEPVLAAAPSFSYRIQKAWIRNKVVYAAGVTIFAALLIGLGTSLWQTAIATRAKKDAQAAEAEKEVQRLEAETARAAESEIRVKSQEQERIVRHMSYASDMNLAQRVLEQNNVGRAKTLLERHQPVEGRTDLRGWEWNYLWSLTQNDSIGTTWSQHEPITSLAVSPGAEWLAFSHDAPARNPRPYRDTEVTISLMNLKTKKVVHELYSESAVFEFSPTRPEFVFSETQDKDSLINIWDLQAGKARSQITLTNAHFGGCAYSQDGETLITSSFTSKSEKYEGGSRGWISSHLLEIWSASDGTFIRRVELPRPLWPSPEGKLLFTADLSMGIWASGSKDVSAVDLSTGRELWTIKVTDDIRVNSLALSPDGKTLVTGPAYITGTIQVWDAATGNHVGKLQGHRSWISDLQFLSDGNLLSASADQTIRLWDMKRLESIRALNGHDREVWALAHSSSDGSIFSGSKDGFIKQWNTASPSKSNTPIRIETPPRDNQWNWQISPDGRSLFIGALKDHRPPENWGYCQIEEWSGDEYGVKTPWPEKFRHFPIPVFSQKDWKVAVVSEAGMLQIWDTRLRRLLQEWRIPFGRAPHLEFDGTGSRIWLSQDEGTEFVYYEWDIDSGRQLHVAKNKQDEFHSYRIERHSPDLQWAFQGNWRGGEKSLLSMMRSQKAVEPILGHYREQKQLFTPDSKSLLVADNQTGWITRWSVEDLWENPDNPKPIATFPGVLTSIHAMACSPDGHRLAIGSAGVEFLKLYDLNNGLELLTFPGDGIVSSIGFSADSKVLACSTSEEFYIWRAPSGGGFVTENALVPAVR